MDPKQEILQCVEQYKKAVHTQEAADFYPIWAKSCETSLISISTCFTGTDSIYEDFLIGGIRKAYTKIELVAKETNVRLLSDSCAVVIFSYYTDCIRRETGEPFGIEGLETQVYIREEDGWKLAHVQYAKNS